ncbi:MAG: hypothetical protein ABUL58_03925, partial [Steroidobacter sp.]
HERRTKPHLFSWITWTLNSLVIFLAQTVSHGGFGAWPIGGSCLITAYTAVLAYRHRTDMSIATTDWVFFAIAVAAMMFWLLTSSPLLAVVLLTGSELVGFGPTFRFTFFHPHEERIGFYFLSSLRNILTISALEYYSLTTVLYPASKCVVSIILVMLIAHRRTQPQFR